jgi:hypothetical protein
MTSRVIVWKQVLLIVSLLFVAVCSKTPGIPKSTKPTAPAIDLSTPDRALKSYWAQKDWLQAVARLELEPVMKRNTLLYRDNMPTVTMGEVSEYFSTASVQEDERFHREIISVKQETDSRAIVLAKITNITPIPSGAEPTKEELESKAGKKAHSFGICSNMTARRGKSPRL